MVELTTDPLKTTRLMEAILGPFYTPPSPKPCFSRSIASSGGKLSTGEACAQEAKSPPNILALIHHRAATKVWGNLCEAGPKAVALGPHGGTWPGKEVPKEGLWTGPHSLSCPVFWGSNQVQIRSGNSPEVHIQVEIRSQIFPVGFFRSKSGLDPISTRFQTRLRTRFRPNSDLRPWFRPWTRQSSQRKDPKIATGVVPPLLPSHHESTQSTEEPTRIMCRAGPTQEKRWYGTVVLPFFPALDEELVAPPGEIQVSKAATYFLIWNSPPLARFLL